MPDTHHERPSFDVLADRFERFAEIHDHFYRPWITAVLPSHGARAVDLGCGSGRFTPLLAERYEQVLAVDIAERELEIARAKRDRLNVTYARRSLLDVTPATDGRFDLVFSVNTIHHLRDHDRVLPHVKDLVAPGGHAVLVDIVTADPTRYASRRWHRKETVADAWRVLRRHRSAVRALDVLRLRTHPCWLDHVTTNTPFTRAQFHQHYGRVFPGADFTDDINAIICAARWQAPAARP